MSVTKFRVDCSFWEGTDGPRRRVTLEAYIEGHWKTLETYMRRERVPGLSKASNLETLVALGYKVTKLSLWSAKTDAAQSASYPVPDDVFREIFHLLYTVPHPGTDHFYQSVEYAATNAT